MLLSVILLNVFVRWCYCQEVIPITTQEFCTFQINCTFGTNSSVAAGIQVSMSADNMTWNIICSYNVSVNVMTVSANLTNRAVFTTEPSMFELTVYNATLSDSGIYSCAVVDIYDNSTVTSVVSVNVTASAVRCTNQCLNGAECITGCESYKCLCSGAWTGNNCDVNNNNNNNNNNTIVTSSLTYAPTSTTSAAGTESYNALGNTSSNTQIGTYTPSTSPTTSTTTVPTDIPKTTTTFATTTTTSTTTTTAPAAANAGTLVDDYTTSEATDNIDLPDSVTIAISIPPPAAPPLAIWAIVVIVFASLLVLVGLIVGAIFFIFKRGRTESKDVEPAKGGDEKMDLNEMSKPTIHTENNNLTPEQTVNNNEPSPLPDDTAKELPQPSENPETNSLLDEPDDERVKLPPLPPNPNRRRRRPLDEYDESINYLSLLAPAGHQVMQVVPPKEISVAVQLEDTKTEPRAFVGQDVLNEGISPPSLPENVEDNLSGNAADDSEIRLPESLVEQTRRRRRPVDEIQELHEGSDLNRSPPSSSIWHQSSSSEPNSLLTERRDPLHEENLSLVKHQEDQPEKNSLRQEVHPQRTPQDSVGYQEIPLTSNSFSEGRPHVTAGENSTPQSAEVELAEGDINNSAVKPNRRRLNRRALTSE